MLSGEQVSHRDTGVDAGQVPDRVLQSPQQVGVLVGQGRTVLRGHCRPEPLEILSPQQVKPLLDLLLVQEARPIIGPSLCPEELG